MDILFRIWSKDRVKVQWVPPFAKGGLATTSLRLGPMGGMADFLLQTTELFINQRD